FSRIADLTRVKGVAFDRRELTADHLVQRGGVTLDVDTLDKDARAACQGKGQVQRLVALIAGDARLDADKVQPLAQRQRLHAANRGFDDRGVIDLAPTNTVLLLELGRIHAGDFADRGDIAKSITRAFIDLEGDVEGI